MIQDRSSERALLLYLLFAGGYPSEPRKIALPDHIHLSTRRFASGPIAYLMRERWIEEETDELGDEQLRLTESGFSRIIEDAKAILKVRFFLGLHPIPEQGAVELTNQSEIASALLLFSHFRELTFFEEITGFLGIPEDERADQAIQEFSARRLIRRENLPRFQEDWYEITVRGREVCELWLSGQSNVAEWPFRALPLANRRHLSETKFSPITPLDIRELGSNELERLAFEYARRELKLRNIRHPGGPYDGGLTCWAKTMLRKSSAVSYCKANRQQTILSASRG